MLFSPRFSSGLQMTCNVRLVVPTFTRMTVRVYVCLWPASMCVHPARCGVGVVSDPAVCMTMCVCLCMSGQRGVVWEESLILLSV